MRTRQAKSPLLEEEIPLNEIEIVDVETVCTVCKAEFLDAEDLKLHVAQTHLTDESERRYCKFCDTAFSSIEEFAYHFRDIHLAEAVFCQHCFRAYADPEELTQHEVKHCVEKGNPTVTCSHCSLIFNKTSELRNHEFTEHRESDDGVLLNSAFALLSGGLSMNIIGVIEAMRNNHTFSCKACSFKSKDLIAYISHRNKRACKTYVCDKCFTVYRAKQSLVRHVQNRRQCQHFVTKRLVKEKCLSCKKYFEIKTIQDHIKQCNAVKCAECDIVFKSVSDLSEHRAKEHKMSVTLQTCKLCNREFVGTTNLKKHIERAHKDIHLYKYRCIYCGVLFMHPKKLFSHFFSRHRDIAPYKCKICNKDFKLRKTFTIHIKMIHNSLGFVEFDENLHTFFTDERSKKPFVPKTPEEILTYAQIDDDGCESDSDISQPGPDNNIEVTIDVQECNTEKAEATQPNGSTEESIEPPKHQFLYKDVNDTTTQASETEDESKNIDRINETDEESPKKLDITTTSNEGEEILTVEALSIPQDDKHNESENLLELINQTETEADQTEAENRPQKARKRKARTKVLPRKRGRPSKEVLVLSDEQSEDEPLIKIREELLKHKKPLPGSLNKTGYKNNKKNLTCNICQKYCYTYQNYYHHMSLHEGNKLKKCIKCHEVFRSKDALESHIEQVHSSSQLTDTLKSMLQKRKDTQKSPAHIPMSERFRRTIKKVEFDDDTTATITPITDNGLSVRNFIENFKPEGADATVNISNSVTIKTTTDPVKKETVIKMRKFETQETVQTSGLCMPVKFKEETGPAYKVTVKLVHKLITKPKLIHFTPIENTEQNQESAEFDYFDGYDNSEHELKNDAIPEVAHEVMLEGTEEVPKAKPFTHQIVLPTLPDQYGEVRIGHLLPEPPFYRIVKVDHILTPPKQEKVEEEDPKDNIQLADGTKLVTVNPFAHLLQADQLQKVLEANKSRYYRSRHRNIERAIAKAMEPKQYRKKKPLVSDESMPSII